MKRLSLAVTLASVLGCSGNVESTSSSGTSSAGAGGATGTSSGGAAQGGTTGQGGTGGIFPTGGGGSGGDTTSSMSCPVVPGEGFHVKFTLDGQPYDFTSPCGSGDDGMGPLAYMFHGKGGGPHFDIFACKTALDPVPGISIFADDPTAPDTLTTIQFSDSDGDAPSTTTGATTFTTLGPEWTAVSGTFHGKLASVGGAFLTLDGSFLVCRRPDLYAP